MRDLLYFLYDFDFFSAYETANESSLMMGRRYTVSAIDHSSTSSVTEEDCYGSSDDMDSDDQQ